MNSTNTELNKMNIAKQELESGEVEIKISGHMDTLGCKALKPTIQEMFNNIPADKVTLNLSDVPHLDSTGIGTIVYMFKKLKADNKLFEITGVHGQPEELLKLLRVDRVIPILSKE